MIKKLRVKKRKFLRKSEYLLMIYEVYGDKDLEYLLRLRDGLNILISHKKDNGGDFVDYINTHYFGFLEMTDYGKK